MSHSALQSPSGKHHQNPSETTAEKPESRIHGWEFLHKQAWLPIPLFLLAMIGLWLTGNKITFEPPYLLAILNFFFSTCVMLLVALLAARSYIHSPSPSVLLLGCSSLCYGTVGLIAAVAVHFQLINLALTVYNTGIFLTGLGMFLSALFGQTSFSPKSRHPELHIIISYIMLVAIIGLLTFAAWENLTPAFFIQNRGGTPLRQGLLIAAIIFFALAAIVTGLGGRHRPRSFAKWYASGLGLIACGLFAILIVNAVGSPLGWLGRTAQYMGGVYILVAILAIVRSESHWKLNLQDALFQSEERYRQLFENMNEGFYLAEIIRDEKSGMPYDYLILAANPAVEKILGIKPEEAIGKTRSELLSTPSPWIDRFSRVALTGVPDCFEGYSKDLERHLLLNVFSPRYGQFACVIMDISNQKRFEQDLQDMTKHLEQRVAERTAEVRRYASRLRGLANQLIRVEQREHKRMAKIVHDQIQQLIVAARMQTEWLLKGEDSSRGRPTIERIYNILEEALQVSRSLTVELSPPVLYQAGLVGSLKWLVSRMQEQYQFKVKFHTGVAADRVSLPEETGILVFECVRELLFNVIKHAGVREAYLELVQDSEKEIRLTVADRGKGFDPDTVTRLQTEETSFGLFSIRERLNYFQGKMAIRSIYGKGTKITLTVPVTETALAKEDLKESATKMANTMTIPRKPALCRVLIVDDHKIMRQGLASLFQAEPDIEVVGEAVSGPQAIKLAAEHVPDIILMDINLGEMDGIEATRRILAQNPQIKVIGLSMHIDQEVADRMYEAGAVNYLTKGAPSEELLDAIRSGLSTPEAITR